MWPILAFVQGEMRSRMTRVLMVGRSDCNWSVAGGGLLYTQMGDHKTEDSTRNVTRVECQISL